MQLRFPLLALAIAISATACASNPYYSTVAHQTGVNGPAFQEKPETLAHWKVLAERLADQAAPSLSDVVVSSRAIGQQSAFDMAFHDFFITALHEKGVAIDDRGARVEVDTYPISFPAHPNHVHDQFNRHGYAPSLELGVNVRVFEGSRLAFSGSQTYYLPARDLQNYRAVPRTAEPKRVKVVGE